MRNELYAIGIFLLVIWLVFAVDAMIPAALTDWGLRPRSADGLVGIPLMPFLHGGLGHILGNTLPLIILLFLLARTRAGSWRIVVGIVLTSGLLLWLIGRSVVHVGASGLVFGLIAFLIVSGILEKRPMSLAISFLVGAMYGGTLLTGVIPYWDRNASWDGHLCGVIAGGLIAYLMVSFSKSERGLFARKRLKG